MPPKRLSVSLTWAWISQSKVGQTPKQREVEEMVPVVRLFRKWRLANAAICIHMHVKRPEQASLKITAARMAIDTTVKS